MNCHKKFVCATCDVPDSALLHWSHGLRHQTSFTSPIRKYADLTVHRQILGMSTCCHHPHDQDAAYHIHCARVLNANEGNHSAFNKAVEKMFTTLSGPRAAFTVSIDAKLSKFNVCAELGALRVSRDMSKATLDDDCITAGGNPVNVAKKR
jgi:hypothetical protein